MVKMENLPGQVKRKVPFNPKDIVLLDDLDWLHCFEKCENYGEHFNCPPFVLRPSEMRETIDCYSKASLLVLDGVMESDRRKMNNIMRETNLEMLRAEREERSAGYHRATVFFVYPCNMCGVCHASKVPGVDKDGNHEEAYAFCPKPHDTRPTLETCMDVFATVKNIGYGMKKYRHGEPYEMVSVLLLK
jgi:predicted metal-binding protein